MSDQFQHVMVLASIIIGLGITHALLGFSTVIDRISGARERLRLSWAWAFWLAFVFIWMVQFWWWEFRLLSVLKTWSMSNYLLVIVYAVVLFLLVAVLVPRRWEEVDDLGAYFLSKRKWFYAVFALGMALDVVDSAMKGGLAYIEASGLGLDAMGGGGACRGRRLPFRRHAGPYRVGDHVFHVDGGDRLRSADIAEAVSRDRFEIGVVVIDQTEKSIRFKSSSNVGPVGFQSNALRVHALDAERSRLTNAPSQPK